MSENRDNNRRPIQINADRVIINADEVIVIEANDNRRHRRNNVAGIQDQMDHHDGDVMGIEDDRRKRRSPWW